MKNKILITLSLVSFLLAPSAFAADSGFSAEQKSQLEQIISDYVSNHPEIIVAAMQKLEKQQAAAQEQNLQIYGENIRKDEGTPSLGKRTAKHYLIEFFDFNCGYCKVMEPFMEQLVEDKDVDIQICYVNYPLLAQSSIMAATVALAINTLDKNKYFEFHKILMTEEVKIDDLDAMKTIVERIGMKWDDVYAEVKNKKAQEKLSENIFTGKTLNVTGTPFFIIDGREVRGAFRSYDDLKKVILQGKM